MPYFLKIIENLSKCLCWWNFRWVSRTYNWCSIDQFTNQLGTPWKTQRIQCSSWITSQTLYHWATQAAPPSFPIQPPPPIRFSQSEVLFIHIYEILVKKTKDCSLEWLMNICFGLFTFSWSSDMYATGTRFWPHWVAQKVAHLTNGP